MEQEADADRLKDDEQLEQAVAAAECERYGHVPPQPVHIDPDDAVVFVPWGLSSPFLKPPCCQRCGGELPEDGGGPRDV
jgi:hypothetical protein